MDSNKEGENDKNILYKGIQQYTSEPEDPQKRRIMIKFTKFISSEYISHSFPFKGEKNCKSL